SNNQRSNSSKGVRFNDDVIGRSLHNLNNELQSLSSEHGKLKHEISKTTSSKHQQQKESLNLNDSDDPDENDSFLSKQDPLVDEV
ncbi:unnamed protein product, partial [Rotaria sp. Silwood2]